MSQNNKNKLFSIFDPPAGDDDMAEQSTNDSVPGNSRSNAPANQNGRNVDTNGRNMDWAATSAEDADNSVPQNGQNPFDDVFESVDENSPSSSAVRPFTYPAGSELPEVRHDAAYRRYVANQNPEAVSELLQRPGFRRHGLESHMIGSQTYNPETVRSRFASSHAPGASSSTSSVGFAGSRGSDSFYTNPNSTPEANSQFQYVRHVIQAGDSFDWIVDPMAGSSDEVVVLELRQKEAVFSFRSGQIIQASMAEFFGILQRNVAAVGFKLALVNVRYYFEQDRIWRFFLRQVADITVSGFAIAADVATIIRVSHRVSQFYIQRLTVTDGTFDTIVDSFDYALQTMAVNLLGFNDSTFIGALRPVALRCYRIGTALRSLVLVVSDFPEYVSLLPYIMHVHLIVTHRLTVLVHQQPLDRYIDVLDRFRLMTGDAPQFLLAYQMVHLGSRFAIYQCQRGNVMFNIGFLMPEATT